MPLPRWFTVEEETGLFEISVLPVNYDDLMHKDFDSMEVLGVGPSPGGGDDGQVPTNVFFEIAYFQEGFDPKRLVSTGLAFEDLELLGDDGSLVKISRHVVRGGPINFTPRAHAW